MHNSNIKLIGLPPLKIKKNNYFNPFNLYFIRYAYTEVFINKFSRRWTCDKTYLNNALTHIYQSSGYWLEYILREYLCRDFIFYINLICFYLMIIKPTEASSIMTYLTLSIVLKCMYLVYPRKWSIKMHTFKINENKNEY